MQITVQYFEPKPFNWWIVIAIIGWLLFFIMLGLYFFPDLEEARAEEINLDIIAKIESNNNPLAVSYRGTKYGRGLYQISEIALLDYNNCHPASKMPTNALFSPIEAQKVAEWYISRIKQILQNKGISAEINAILISWNWGVGNYIKWHKAGADYKRLPYETQNYLKKFWKLYNNGH